MKQFTIETFEEYFSKITPEQFWWVKRENGSLVVYNEKVSYSLKELDLKLWDHVQDGKYLVIAVLGKYAKADGLIRFCFRRNPVTFTGDIHYELTCKGHEYVKSIRNVYDISYDAIDGKVRTFVN